MPESITPPTPRPDGPGAKSDPGPRAGGDLPGWVQPGRAGQDSAPELFREVGSGRRGAGEPGGGGGGWSGLAVRGPGRALGPGSYLEFLAPSLPPQNCTGPTSSCALIWMLGREIRGGGPTPNRVHGLQPVALVTRPRSQAASPSSQPMEQSSAARLSSRRWLRAEPFLDGGEQTMTRGVCSWVVTSPRVACRGSSSQAQNLAGPG